MTETPTASSLLQKAVEEINENDAKGAVKQITTLMKLVMSNDAEILKLQVSSKELKDKIAELAGAGALSATSFS